MATKKSAIYRLWYEIDNQEYSYIGYSSNFDHERPLLEIKLNNYKKYFNHVVSKGAEKAKNNLESIFKHYELPEKQGFALKVVLLSLKYDFDCLNFELEKLKTKPFEKQGKWTKSAERTYYIKHYNSELKGFNGLNAGQGHQTISNYDAKIKSYQESVNKDNSIALPWIHYKLFEKKANQVWKTFVNEIRPKYQQKTSNSKE